MEKKEMYTWLGIAVCFLVPGLWMFSVAPTAWFVGAIQKTRWLTVATILTVIGTFIILGVSAFVAGVLHNKRKRLWKKRRGVNDEV